MKTSRNVRSQVSLLTALMFWLVSGPVHAAIFLEIPGVPGESNDAQHRDWIDVLSAAGNFTKNSCGEFAVTKEIDASFPRLVASVVSGRLFPRVTLEFTATYGGVRKVYSTITLENAAISSIATSASGNDQAGPPVEQITIKASSIVIEYTQFDDAGRTVASFGETVICGKSK